MMMMHGHGGDVHWRVGAAGKEAVNLLWANTESSGGGERDDVRDDSMDGGLEPGFSRATQQQLGFDDFRIDDQWLLDPSVISLHDKIGEGGHANVYLGRYKKAIVAVEIIKPGGTAAELARRRERFLREIWMLSRVHQHDNLVTIICFLPRDHNKVKLADFGLAREETLTEMMTAETGTYRWMAPEKVRPDLGNIPKELVPVLECCWAEDSNSRPGFQQVIEMLSVIRTSLSPLKTMPPPTIVLGGSSYVATDSPVHAT